MTTAPATKAGHRLCLILAGSLALAVVVRLPLLFLPLQADEFNTVFEIAAREGAGPDRLPGADAPLRLLPNAAAVRTRAILPYGISNPFPVYALALHALLRPFPVAPWSLRLPSLGAGLLTVVLLTLIAHRLAGSPAALVAGLLSALEPFSVVSSATARPYAAAGAVIALSFLVHPAVIAPVRWPTRCASAFGSGLAIALAGYLNPVLLLAAAGSLLLLGLPVVLTAPPGRGVQLRHAAFLAGFFLAGFLCLVPLGPYLWDLNAQHRRVQPFLSAPDGQLGSEMTLAFLFDHNAVPVLLLLACSMTWAVARRRGDTAALPWRSGSEATMPGAVRPDGGRVLMLVGAVWLVAPQAAAAALRLFGGPGVFLNRYLFYTVAGGVLLAAGIVGRRAGAGARREATALCLVAIALLLAVRQAQGKNVLTNRFPTAAAGALRNLDEQGLWRDGDVLMLQAGMLEADFAGTAVPPGNRERLRELLLAPLSTVYVGDAPRHALALSKAHGCEGERPEAAGLRRARDANYSAAVVARLQPHPRFWFLGLASDTPEFLSFFLPWLARSLGSPLTVSFRSLDRPGEVLRTLRVEPGSRDWEPLAVPRGELFGPLAVVERVI